MLLSALSIGEKFSLGGTTTLLGLGMTFVVLALLIGFVYLINIIIKLIETKLSGKLSKKFKETTVAIDETVSAVEAAKKEEIDEETMIAIRSAVEVYSRETDKEGKAHNNVTILSVKEL